MAETEEFHHDSSYVRPADRQGDEGNVSVKSSTKTAVSERSQAPELCAVRCCLQGVQKNSVSLCSRSQEKRNSVILCRVIAKRAQAGLFMSKFTTKRNAVPFSRQMVGERQN